MKCLVLFWWLAEAKPTKLMLVAGRQYLNPFYLIYHSATGCVSAFVVTYHQTSNIRGTFVGNYIVDHSDVVGAAPYGSPSENEVSLTYMGKYNLWIDEWLYNNTEQNKTNQCHCFMNSNIIPLTNRGNRKIILVSVKLSLKICVKLADH